MQKLVLIILFVLGVESSFTGSVRFFGADDKNIQYTGRVDFSNPAKPRFWTAGVYIQARFEGTSCEIVINDEVLGGKFHNYLEVVIDGGVPVKIQTKSNSNTIKVAEGLAPGVHTITLCKNTEALIGYLEFVGFRCEALLAPVPKPSRKLEFIGDSITSGMGSDLSDVPCDKAQWYDQHNAYYSYGPMVARQLHAQWHLTSDSGIGLIHSCCNKHFVMPDLFDKVSLSNDSLIWDFSRYQPDAVTICLGQNDGIQDSAKFCTAYVHFVRTIRGHYPGATIICLTSPMANEALRSSMKKNLTSIVSYLHQHGESNVDRFFFSRSFNSGCGGHPDLSDHRLIANELAEFLVVKLDW